MLHRKGGRARRRGLDPRAATDDQLQACFDLDAWREAPDPGSLDAWFGALADATYTLIRGARSVDTELLYLYLRGHISAYLKPNDDSWQPGEGDQTLEGQFFYRAIADGDDLATVTRPLRGLFEQDYWLYLRMLQALTWEDVAENEEYARRWRSGRLEDLGFPTWEEAMRIYGFLRPPNVSRCRRMEGAVGGGLASAGVCPGFRWAPTRVTSCSALQPRSTTRSDARSSSPSSRWPIRWPWRTGCRSVTSESIPEAIEKAARLASRAWSCWRTTTV